MLKSLFLFPIVAVLSVSTQAATLPGDAANGKKLHDASCTSCHNDSVYKRQDHKIKSLEGLTQQIRNCEHMTDVTLGKTQVSDLVKFLNETYYKFK
jgi:cytochrome c553